jgi:glycosyltransferase involved in cell wall biosynthesis
MKLVYVANEIKGATGLERMIVVQINYFIEHYNYHIEIIVMNEKSTDQASLYKLNDKTVLHNLNLQNEESNGFFSKIIGLNKLLTEISPDVTVVCIDDILGLYLPLFLKKRFRTVYQRHSTKNINLDRRSKSLKAHLFNAIKKVLISKAGNGYDKFVLLSNGHRQDWKHLNNIEVINNPLILDATGKALLDNKTVLAVGRQDYIKGYDMLLQSWREVIESHPDWNLKIYGKIDKGLNLEALARELGVFNNVYFHEHTQDITEVYMGASILTCSSRIEGFSLVILEAMSCGVPVISFDCPYGPKAIINDFEDGVLVPPNNINSFADSIKLLIEDQDLRKKLGGQAKENVLRFSPDNIFPQWKSLFENLKEN